MAKENITGKITGANFRRLLKENHMTQQAFADHYGMELRNVSRWINEEKLTNIMDIQALADYFDVPFSEFFKTI